MIAWILEKKFKMLKTYGNLNNLIGTPLTLFKLNSDHEIAVIEMGTNQPGEIPELVSIVKPTMALITNIGRGHLQNFSSIDGLAQEKLSLFKGINRRGIIFLNRDDKRLPKFPFRRKTLWSYSLQGKKRSKVQGQFDSLNKEGKGIWQLNGKVTITMNVPGKHHVQNALAASTVALYFGLNENEIKEALETYTGFDKRMQIIQSGGMVIINDCYNANPDSFNAALQTLNHMASDKDGRKIVVIGDMLELGLESEPLHQNLFLSMLEYDVCGIFAIGQMSSIAAKNLKEKGFENAFWFSQHEELSKELKKFIKKGDYLLVKGSRGMQMEKVLNYL
jgi:UDP-N-acetylmuramoyl-tripeptide--D-alanyl-D-alanine ligase